MSEKRVVLFGLSANPPTGLGGHMGIVEYFSKLFDEVWILPVYRHAYSSKRHLESYENRITMLDLSLQDCHLENSNIFVKKYEQECFEALFPGEDPSDPNLSFGTVDLVRWAKEKFPSIHFSMIIGEDAFNDICEDKWKESALLRSIIHFEVLRRKGISNEEHPTNGNWYSFHSDIDLAEVSSTYPCSYCSYDCCTFTYDGSFYH